MKLQYWHATWDGRSDIVRGEAGAGGVGWDAMDDWTNGQWKNADATIDVVGREWTFPFRRTGEREFESLGQPGVHYRKTLMVRLMAADRLSQNTLPHAYTDALLQPRPAPPTNHISTSFCLT